VTERRNKKVTVLNLNGFETGGDKVNLPVNRNGTSRLSLCCYSSRIPPKLPFGPRV